MGAANWVNFEKENALWESYYKELGIIPEAEWDEFKKCCQSPLPLTFRITGSAQYAAEVRESMIKDYIPHLKNIEFEGEIVEAPSPIPFYPNELAWQVKVGKTVIRKNKAFARFQRFLVVETDVGHISRQETVSMIPPLLLDVKPHHSVLDMCAAPGSKTAQIIEALHAEPNPSGVVVANDADYKRSHMLIHQVKRLNSPNLVVVNHDAQFFPKIRTLGNDFLKFDRVLCDVPCSGDATMRKNVNVWKDFGTGAALGLHQTQINILMRGIQLLKAGGRVVYSTCSLNPIENEAVVAEALRLSKGTVKLVDCSDRLAGLVRREGITSWKVMGKDKKWKEEGDESILKSCFPPTSQEINEMSLNRCVRVYPHLQDTGGFFICAFEKIEDDIEQSPEVTVEAPIAETSSVAESIETTPAPLGESAIDSEVSVKKDKLPRDANEEPFKFLAPYHPVLESCWEFYNVSKEFSRDTLLVRNMNGDPVRSIYYVASSVRPILELNESKLKFVHSGVKMFAQQKGSCICNWRVQSEGLSIIYPYAGDERKLVGSQKILKMMCDVQFTKFDALDSVDPAFKEKLLALSEGCAFFVLEAEEGKTQALYPMWKGRSSFNLMLAKKDTEEILHRVFGEENIKNKQDTRPQPLTSTEPTPDAATVAEGTSDIEAEATPEVVVPGTMEESTA
ncbi:S-adenosyl-L-methionine-dependent methyltransferase [Nadsonia fulvescens var. elongata DSM 6958]|uniref:S-adenosyl-L-methionine-dependent methyltransferase n=1 Tax=Nadsonia fulvescens var. elongata DSM 6958 TaxID=857566 RepID=A0A1E3PQQ8_9ASCO|nr:S-adenosyl-L-methionine-dependent methyltransferase [Nadsonia fulvescens var. elongata DSM 6958]